MSESILKALIRLFALISVVHDNADISSKSKDIIRLFLLLHLNNELVIRYMGMFNEYLSLYHRENIEKGSLKERKRTSLTAMRILAICEQINEELYHKQKVYVIVHLMDFILYSAEVTDTELDFVDTVSAAFNIDQVEYQNIKSFVLGSACDVPEKNRVLIIDNKKECETKGVKHLHKENLRASIILLHITSINTYILRYSGKENIFLNGQNVSPGQTYPFDHGSTIRSSGINTIYYNDVNSIFTEEVYGLKVTVDANDVCFRFRNSDNGIHNLNFHEESGKLIGILGGSGVGKSTLLNVLSGMLKPQSGKVVINGFDLYSEKENDRLEGVIGFIPQDDLLIEELTVFQNLYYNARMCLDNLPEPKIREAVNKTLTELDLDEIKDLKVGSPLNKVISGGQRKRLNIALELIREPTILFVDEPTSGLSSVDSEIVMNLLKEQSYRGKLVMINIHQPGSDLYKMFDKIMLIDKGGYQIFYGDPAEAIVYFKTKSSHANAGEDRCPACGNVSPDQLLQIIEARVVDENGKPTHIRKVSPMEWAERFQEEVYENKQNINHEYRELPENYYSIPGLIQQTKIFFVRDILSKLSNRQYVMISLLVAPVLALLLAYFTKYIADGEYLFSENENLPAYLFMCVITSLFLGLIISAEEIIRDRKILKRELFLNLSWFSYLNSKVMIMFLISAIQTITFIVIGNLIFEIRGMILSYWIVLFTTSCCANMLGLNISLALNSVITIYIVIPLILIPQLLFSGVLVKFDKLHKNDIASYEFTPVIGDVMPARWSFEALAVEQFKNNNYERNYFKYNMEISQNEWYASFLIPNLKQDLLECEVYKDSMEYREILFDNYKKLNYYIDNLRELTGFPFIPGEWKASLNEESFNSEVAEESKEYLDSLATYIRGLRKKANSLKDSVTRSLEAKIGKEELVNLKDKYENMKLKELVLDLATIEKSIETPDKIIQKYAPGYMKPVSRCGRAQFYTPYKQIGKMKIQTYWFDILVLWLVTVILYITLYYKILQKTIIFFGFIHNIYLKSRSSENRLE